MNRNGQERQEWTGFQESRPYGPKYDLRTDFVMVYGISEDLPRRIEGWKKAGYSIHLMTGVSWGEYQDYLYGRFDGREHWDEAQTESSGSRLLHGKDVPYMVPTISFADYLAAQIKKAIDCGVEAIHLEEPEFWAQAGYEEAFKREWLNYYGEEWQEPHSSPDAQYRASKLKAAMYYRALDRICSEMKEYSLVAYGRRVRFYVPTHSLINYTQWRIVSPEALLVSMPACDGFIAQIWTGTARTANVYKGVRRERTFETAYLEYGIMQELTRGTGREMWFLHDPIEDNPRYSWSDYRRNYRATVAASLLHPGVSRYEVCPWPWRVFELPYPTEDGKGKETIPGGYATVLLTVMNVLRDMHNHDEVSGADGGEAAETGGIGLCLANSAMYQRGDVLAEGDEGEGFNYDGTAAAGALTERQQELLDWSAFYGLALPPVKKGIPLRPVQLDNILTFPGYLEGYRVLLLSYEFMKPEHPGIHQALGQWVREGGVLVYAGDGSDPFHRVSEWWNRGAGSRIYERPEEHLFESMGLGRNPEEGEHAVGDGAVLYLRSHPAGLSRSPEGAEKVLASIRLALELRGEADEYRESGMLRIQRGPYVIAHALDEEEAAGSDAAAGANAAEAEIAAGANTAGFNAEAAAAPATGREAATAAVLQGSFIDLFEADLPVLQRVELAPGENCLLYDLSYAGASAEASAGSAPEGGGRNAGEAGGCAAALLASSSRIRDERREGSVFSYVSEAPAGILVSTRLRVPFSPARALAEPADDGASGETSGEASGSAGLSGLDGAGAADELSVETVFDSASSTLLLRHPGRPTGVRITLAWS
ncbi:hypothetical protein [Paenibacillus humicus]|uniref:hypothetical protein n=1 Tax=Paenibacillus humicus TaxID=412861 RepID=UPI003F1449D7